MVAAAEDMHGRRSGSGYSGSWSPVSSRDTTRPAAERATQFCAGTWKSRSTRWFQDGPARCGVRRGRTAARPVDTVLYRDDPPWRRQGGGLVTEGTGWVALVTGASSGIGAATAR